MKVCRLCRRYASGAADQCTYDGGELLEAPVPPVAPGESIGPYVVKRALAAGQSGVLLLCFEEEAGEGSGERGAIRDRDRTGDVLEDLVVVKVLNKVAGSTDARRPVLESAAALSMPGLHPILEILEHGDRLCVVEALLQGTTLAASLPRSGPLDQPDALAIGRRLCDVLAVVHESGLSHLDVRPGHLFVPEGASVRDAVLLDLGSPSPPGRLSAPELFVGGPPNPEATDVYGLCVTLYVLLGGRSPFRTDDPEELSWLIRNTPPPPLRVVRRTGGVDPALERLILWGMSKDPRDRPSLARVGAALEALDAGDHEAIDRALDEAADQTSRVARASRSSRPSLPRFLSETSATLKFVERILPSRLKSTGLTQGFYIAGEEMERDLAMAEAEERLARRDNLIAWLRLGALLTVALALGGFAVWMLMR